MFIQDQLSHTLLNDDNLAYFKAIGVDYLTINPLPFAADNKGALATRDEMTEYLKSASNLAKKHELQLMNVALEGPDEITLGRPNRDSKIEQWKDALAALASAGVKTLGYNFKPIGNFRTTSTVGRGGAYYSTFDYKEWKNTESEWEPAFRDKQIDERGMWENISYFLERIIPVAEECDIRMALHPDDPPIPEAMGGAARIVSTLDQYEKIFSLVPSQCNAMLFCQGCVTEMGVDVFDSIQRVGRQGKIAYVHFRNVRGSRTHFEEVFVDEGDVDMLRAMQTYKAVGFAGPFMMDHTPSIPGDRQGREGHALATGFIRAMIQAVYGRNSETTE